MRSTLITVRLILVTSGGVTAPEARRLEPVTVAGETRTRNVLPVRRDPAGQPYLPGTTVAGSLRAHCAGRPELAGKFGGCPGDDDKRAASAIQVLGVITRGVADPQRHTRTAVDRRRAAPAGRTLHTVEQLPAGTEFDIFVRWDDAGEAELDAFRAAVASWRPSLGRGSSLGAGRCKVAGYASRGYDLATVEGLLAWLRLSGPADYPRPEPITSTAVAPRVLRSVRFAVDDALHIGTGSPRLEPDGHHINPVLRAGTSYLIPGSTIKGMLRSRAEYICRVLGLPACPGSARPRPGCSVAAPCRPCRIFGRGTVEGVDGVDGSRRAAVAIPDAEVVDAELERRPHVAIDRFTAGARDALLYRDEVLTSGQLTIVIEEIDPYLDDGDLALIDAVLTDIGDGLVGIGARTTAGYGTLRIADPSWHAPDLSRLRSQLTGTAQGTTT